MGARPPKGHSCVPHPLTATKNHCKQTINYMAKVSQETFAPSPDVVGAQRRVSGFAPSLVAGLLLSGHIAM